VNDSEAPWQGSEGSSVGTGALHSGPLPDERDELIAALQQLTTFTEGLLTLSERLVRAYDTDARPSAEEID